MRLASIVLSSISLGVSPALAMDITTCGQTVTAGEVGVLQAPLVCDAPAAAVTLEQRATLDLNGHVLTASAGSAVHCTGSSCIVDGGNGAPAEITGLGTGFFGIVGTPDKNRRIAVRNVVIRDVADAGIYNDNATLVVTGVEVENGGQFGIRGRRAKLTDVAVVDSDHGITTAKGVIGTGIEASNNANWGLSGGGASVRVTDLTAMNNGGVGVYAKRVSLRDSMLLGNAVADVAAVRRPRLRDTICEVSGFDLFFPSLPPAWDACSLD